MLITVAESMLSTELIIDYVKAYLPEAKWARFPPSKVVPAPFDF